MVWCNKNIYVYTELEPESANCTDIFANKGKPQKR